MLFPPVFATSVAPETSACFCFRTVLVKLSSCYVTGL